MNCFFSASDSTRLCGAQVFPSTDWSMVMHAGEDASGPREDALARLCQRYWMPVYAYVYYRKRHVQDAQGSTQAFFLQLLQKNHVKSAHVDKGRFRSYLITAVKHFLANEWDRTRAQKRGGGKVFPVSHSFLIDAAEPLDVNREETPESMFEKHWVRTLLSRTVQKLEDEWNDAGKAKQFKHFSPFLLHDAQGLSYRDAAAAVGMTESAVKVAIHRMRRRFRLLLCQEVGETLDSPEEIDDEIQYLMRVFD